MKFVFSLVLPFLAAGIGQLVITDWMPWYQSLNSPFFAPPNWVFGPVWTLLYLCMGIAFYLVWTEKTDTLKARKFYLVQLVLNALWSPIFFGLQNIQLALIEILFLNLLIFLTVKEFYKINKRAAYLLLPYFAWTLFAMCLNAGFWWLN